VEKIKTDKTDIKKKRIECLLFITLPSFL